MFSFGIRNPRRLVGSKTAGALSCLPSSSGNRTAPSIASPNADEGKRCLAEVAHAVGDRLRTFPARLRPKALHFGNPRLLRYDKNDVDE